MTYSQQVKNELCNVKLQCKNCQKALAFGVLLTSRGVSEHSIIINTENKHLADFFAQSIIDVSGAIVTVHHPNLRERNKRPIYTVTVESQSDIDRIMQLYYPKNNKDGCYLNWDVLQRECCQLAFLRGAYLSCGAMINPEKEYHLEFSVSNEEICDDLLDLLNQFNLDFRLTTRGKNFVLYIKESQLIEDTLTTLGAVKSSLELMNLKIVKEIRNKANRRTNCETANIEKTVNAAMTQITKIEYILKTKGLDYLPIELQEVAKLRLNNPDASLSELCQLSSQKISRSGLNHRLNKLCSIADELRGQKEVK